MPVNIDEQGETEPELKDPSKIVEIHNQQENIPQQNHGETCNMHH